MRRVWISLAALLLVGIAITGVRFQRETVPFISATQPRPAPEYEKALAPSQPVLALPPGLYENISVTNAEGRVLISWTNSAMHEPVPNTYEHTIHHVPASQVLQGDDWLVRVEHIAVAYGAFRLDRLTEYSEQIQAQFFDAKLSPLPETDFKKIGARQRELSYRGRFPAVRLVIDSQGLDEIKILKVQLFDSRTRQNLSSGYSTSAVTNRIQTELEVEMWHPGPVELLLTIAHGPAQTFEMNVKEGAVVQVPGGKIHLAAIAPGGHRSWAVSSHGNVQNLTISLDPAKTNETSFAFLCYPRASALPIEVELLDADGNELQSAGGGASDILRLESVRSPINGIAKAKVKYFPHVKLFVFRFPEIPGLPEINRGVENLLEVQVPFLRFREPYEIRNFISGVLQVDMQHTAFPSAPGLFPAVYTNATAEFVLMDYAAKVAPGRLIAVDEENNALRFEPPLMERMLEWIKAKLESF